MSGTKTSKVPISGSDVSGISVMIPILWSRYDTSSIQSKYCIVVTWLYTVIFALVFHLVFSSMAL